MKYGVSIKINVSKIDKARLFDGKQGKYLDATVFIDVDNEDQYGNNGMVTQDVTKEERDQGVKGNILGNVKVFYRDAGQAQPNLHNQGMNQAAPPADGGFDDDIPFN